MLVVGERRRIGMRVAWRERLRSRLAVVAAAGAPGGAPRRWRRHRLAWPGLRLAKRWRDLADRDLDAEVAVQPGQRASPPGADLLADLNDVSRRRQLGAKQYFEQHARPCPSGPGGLGPLPRRVARRDQPIRPAGQP